MERTHNKDKGSRNRMPSYGRVMEEKKLTAAVDGISSGGSMSEQTKHSSSNSSVRSLDEAYRRVGHRLSRSVSGDSVSTQRMILRATPNGAFSAVLPKTPVSCSLTVSTLSTEDGDSSSQPASYDRTHKVAKMHLRDHGEHTSKLRQGVHLTSGEGEGSSDCSILKKVTCLSRERNLLFKQKSHSKKRCSPNTTETSSPSSLVSPQRHALSKLALEHQDSSAAKGLLHSVLEGEPTACTTAETELTTPSPSKCLTNPSTPVANDGYDNVDGNLIVHQNQVLHMRARDFLTQKNKTIQLRVVEALGQGTFAQVFKCLDIANNRMVALKVVKNRPAYTRQAAVEIDVFLALGENNQADTKKRKNSNVMVQLLSYCMHQNHLCLVFELLGLNLYEVLKRRQFRGLKLSSVRSLLQQALEGLKDLSQKSIVHCDLKPENVLLSQDEDTIKLIDFGSACFEGHTAHTYIQSRFYRSPEVLVGLPYDSAIDMWSLGCVAAELFLGLPILPGVHEHDQLARICEMIGPVPEKMLQEGSKSTKYFVKYFPKSSPENTTKSSPPPRTPPPGTAASTSPPPPPRPKWRIKTQQEYVRSLSANEVKKKGGLAKLEKQPANRYFKRKKLQDIVMLHAGASSSDEDNEALELFVHFLMGMLDPDPWKRWTAFQASMHPFLTGSKLHRRKQSTTTKGEANTGFGIYWVPPWDPSVCRRRLLHVQKTREKQQTMRQKYARDSSRHDQHTISPGSNGTSRVTAMAENMTLNSSAAPAKPSSAPQNAIKETKKSGSPPRVVDGGNAAVATDGRQFAAHNQGAYPGMPYAVSGAASVGARHPADGAGFMNNTPTNMVPPAYFASSLSDLYHPGALMNASVMPMASPSMHAGVGEFNYGQQLLPYPSGAHSYSGMGHDGMHHHPMEAELGYALQRPGVVPGMGSDVPSTPVVLPQLAVPTSTFSPHHMHPIAMNGMPGSRGRSSSFTNPPSSVGRSSARRRRHTFNAMNGPTASTPQSPYMPGSYMTSPTTSIREDGAVYDLGEENAMNSHSAPGAAAAAGGTTSLLAQQLAEHAGSVPMTQDPTSRMAEPGIQRGFEGPSSLPPGGYGPSPAMYGSNVPTAASQMNMYYYVAADGTPVMLPPQQPAAQMAPMYGSHGSFQDPSMMMPIPYGASTAPMHAMPPGAQVPTHLAQPSFEEMEMQRHHNGMPHWSGVVPPQPRRPPSYHGSSM